MKIFFESFAVNNTLCVFACMDGGCGSSDYWLNWCVSGHILTGLGDYWTKLRHSGTRVIKYTADTAQQHVTCLG